MARTYNLFISHSWAYGDAYGKLCGFLNARPYFSYRNYSVPKDDPIHNAPTAPALAAAIQRQMTPCNIVLIMAGVYATYSEWITREIRIATGQFSNPKPIVGIMPWGSERLSSVVRDSSDRLVGWNTESIVSPIRELAI